MNVEVEDIIRNNIGATVHMSLATVSNNRPWVCEVHFAYDEELNLYFRSKASRRHSQEIAQNPYVSGNIVKQFELGEPVVGVYFEGTAEQLAHVTEESPAFVALQRLGLKTDALTEAENEADGHKFYKITVKNWYAFGRFGADHGQKLSLEWNK